MGRRGRCRGVENQDVAQRAVKASREFRTYKKSQSIRSDSRHGLARSLKARSMLVSIPRTPGKSANHALSVAVYLAPTLEMPPGLSDKPRLAREVLNLEES